MCAACSRTCVQPSTWNSCADRVVIHRRAQSALTKSPPLTNAVAAGAGTAPGDAVSTSSAAPASAPATPVPVPAPARPPVRSAPSGIAQLRKSEGELAHAAAAPGEAMNLDDFILPSSVGSPAGLLDEPPNEMGPPSHATAPAIPIRKANQSSHDQNHALAHASAPPVPPIVTREHEFGYVQRHVRKTSIDERRVSRPCPLPLSLPPFHTPHSSANLLSAPQATSRGLSAGTSREQHHDA